MKSAAVSGRPDYSQVSVLVSVVTPTRPTRTPDEIRADIKALEKETEGLFVTLETTGTERKHRDR